jgi:hypothetical protein
MSANTSMSFLLLSSVAALLVACGEDKPAETGGAGGVQCPPGQYYDGRFCQTQGAQPGATAAPATTAPPAGTAPGVAVPPGVVATTTAGPTATPLDPTAAQAATQLIAPLGTQHAPAGAKPVGAAIAGNFQQGQSLESQIQMNPGKCYTVVGVALPPATELDIALVPVLPIPGLPSPTLAADVNSKGTTSVVGAKPDCVKWAWPMSGMVKVVMTVSQGSGVAAAQVFEK